MGESIVTLLSPNFSFCMAEAVGLNLNTIVEAAQAAPTFYAYNASGTFSHSTPKYLNGNGKILVAFVIVSYNYDLPLYMVAAGRNTTVKEDGYVKIYVTSSQIMLEDTYASRGSWNYRVSWISYAS